MIETSSPPPHLGALTGKDAQALVRWVREAFPGDVKLLCNDKGLYFTVDNVDLPIDEGFAKSLAHTISEARPQVTDENVLAKTIADTLACVRLQQLSHRQTAHRQALVQLGADKKALLEAVPGVCERMNRLFGEVLHKPSCRINDDGNIVIGVEHGALKQEESLTQYLQKAGIAVLEVKKGDYATFITIDPGQDEFFDKVETAIKAAQNKQSTGRNTGESDPNDIAQVGTR